MDSRLHDNDQPKRLWSLQLMHKVYLATIPIGILITALLPVLGFVPVYNSSSLYLHVIEVAFSSITIICLLFGYYWPRISRRSKTVNSPDVEVTSDHILRMSFFESVAVFGFILGFMGSGWYVWLALFVLAGIALILTFPTKKRWANWIQNRSTS